MGWSGNRAHWTHLRDQCCAGQALQGFGWEDQVVVYGLICEGQKDEFATDGTTSTDPKRVIEIKLGLSLPEEARARVAHEQNQVARANVPLAVGPLPGIQKSLSYGAYEYGSD